MLIAVDERSPEPLYRQIASQVRRAIAAGDVASSKEISVRRGLPS
jgi:DNA-binding transcriptional regulator YhcF (GntR family)